MIVPSSYVGYGSFGPDHLRTMPALPVQCLSACAGVNPALTLQVRSSLIRSTSARTEHVRPAYLPDGSPGIALAARLAGTPVRTLHRRLGEEGVTYSQLIDELRHDLAIYLLRDPARQASEISLKLGYRDPAIFTRAFRRWTGTTPSDFRKAFSV